MNESYYLHFMDGTHAIYSREEVIENALQQEKEGIKPTYLYMDKYGTIGNPGWLVWSTYEDGAGVVYRRDDGKMIVIRGWQGDFVQSLESEA